MKILSVEHDHVVVRSGFFSRSRAVFFDELTDDGGNALVARALTPPAPTENLDEARAAWSAWLAGPRCARRGAKALLAAARALGASDLHLEPAAEGALLRLRLVGELVELCALPRPAPVVAALKGLAGCLPYRSDIAQEGRVEGAGVAADVRASFVPTALGERVALRLFGRLYSFAELGLPEGVATLLAKRSGLFVVAGATGAGKTTTLYACLGELARTRNGAHLSLEDPVEQRLRLAGIAVDQIELDPARGVTAESMLAASLRQDVDVLAVGEVRTPAEAKLALHAAHTGRLVLCGLHAGSSASSMTGARQRLLDLGVDARELDASLVGVLHQELVTEPAGEAGGRRRRLRAELWTPRAGLREVA